MKFAVYAEYPEEDLERLHLLGFPVDIVVASESLREFDDWQRQVHESNDHVGRVGYWPKLKRSEGIWLSPWSDPKGLERVLGELKERNTKDDRLMLKWDAEPPHQTKHHLFTRLPSILANRGKILEFIASHRLYNLDVVSAEFPHQMWKFPLGVLTSYPLLSALALAFDPEDFDMEAVVKIAYTSFGKFQDPVNKFLLGGFTHENLRREAVEGVKRHGKEKFAMAIGCTATGEMETEPVLTISEFERDLGILQNEGIGQVYVFRLGGLTQDHVDIMKSYL